MVERQTLKKKTSRLEFWAVKSYLVQDLDCPFKGMVLLPSARLMRLVKCLTATGTELGSRSAVSEAKASASLKPGSPEVPMRMSRRWVNSKLA